MNREDFDKNLEQLPYSEHAKVVLRLMVPIEALLLAETLYPVLSPTLKEEFEIAAEAGRKVVRELAEARKNQIESN